MEYWIKLSDAGDCTQVTELSGPLTDEDGQVVEETLRLVGACEEADAEECGC